MLTIAQLARLTAPFKDVTVPSADVLDGSWTSSAGGTNLTAVLADMNPATYVSSNPAGGPDSFTVALPDMSTPAAGPIAIYIRHRRA